MSLPATNEGAVPRALVTHLPDAQRSRRMSGFVGFMLDNSTRDDLETWFKKPERGATIQPLPQAESPTYAQVPEDLKRDALLYSADQYYNEQDHRLRPSIWLVKLLTVIFFIPASLVFAFSRAWRTIFRPKASTAPSPPPVALAAEPENKPACTSHSPAPREREEGAAPPSTPHAYSSDGPWSFARSWALWVVYIPMTRYHGTGGFKGVLLPSQSPKFLNDHAAALARGKKIEDNAWDELQLTRTLYKQVVLRRRAALKRAKGALDALDAANKREADNNDDTLNDDPESEFEEALKTFGARTKTASRLKIAVDEAQKEWEWAREVAKTETCAQATKYRGIADWADDAYGSYSNLITAISGVCFVGAGLTYSSIFSANRGSIGLMCWAFSLFIVGLAILITVQSLLVWCSRLDNYPFSTPKLWEFFLGVGVYGACAAVVAAIILLVVTVLNLQFNVDLSQQYTNPNASPWDAHLIFNVSPRYAAIVAFAFIGAGIIVAILVFVLFSMANTVKLLLWRRSIERSRKHRVRLDDLV